MTFKEMFMCVFVAKKLSQKSLIETNALYCLTADDKFICTEQCIMIATEKQPEAKRKTNNQRNG